jgi:translation initiation factor IF-3
LVKKVEIVDRINDKIICEKVRIIGENVENGIFSLKEALEISKSKNLDLVELSVNNSVSICKVLDYSKYKYEKKKEKKKLLKNNFTETKSIKFSYNVDIHDFNFKVEHAKRFLKEGKNVSCFILFKKKEELIKMTMDIFQNIEEELKEFGKVDKRPCFDLNLEHNSKLFLCFSPKRK